MIARDVTRSTPFQIARADGDDPGDGQTFEGYAAPFDTPTRIDSWEGVFDEQIRKGAFRKTIRERVPVMQFEHGRHPLIGSIPLGTISELREDDRGLFVQARLTDNWLIQPIRDAIRDEAVDGMSFRFEVVREEWRDADGKLLKDDAEILQLLYRPDDRGPLQRTLIEVKVPELGPVVFPAYRETTASVRARDAAAVITRDDDLVRDLRASLFDCGCEDRHHEDGARAVDSTAWDGPAAMSRCASSETPASCYRSICAGRKSGDAALQASWALPHHKNPGDPPNAAGVRNSLSRLPQTQGLTNTDAARAHLERHLAAINNQSSNAADLDDPEFRREVARVLLFDAPPTDGHLPDSAPTRSDDAPPADGHPSEDTDAPPDGHPSDLSQRLLEAELARINGLIDTAERKSAS